MPVPIKCVSRRGPMRTGDRDNEHEHEHEASHLQIRALL